MNNKMFRIGAVIVVLLLVFFLINRDDETDVPEEQAKTTVEESDAKQAETDRLTKLAAKKEAEEKTAEAAALREEVGNTIGCDKALAAKNLYLAAYIHQTKLNDNAKAKALYEAVVINFSGSEWDDKAQQKLATL